MRWSELVPVVRHCIRVTDMHKRAQGYALYHEYCYEKQVTLIVTVQLSMRWLPA